MQGWRTGMEDSHLACVDLAGASSAKSVKGPPAKAPMSSTSSPPPPPSSSPSSVVAAFAVFDGHVSFIQMSCSYILPSVSLEELSYVKSSKSQCLMLGPMVYYHYLWYVACV